MRFIDPLGGRRDLEAGRVRVLHPRSFEDDPTRILRAVRYAGRLGFEIEGETARLLAGSLRWLDSVSGDRIRRELERIAAEERLADILELAERFGILRLFIRPSRSRTDLQAACAMARRRPCQGSLAHWRRVPAARPETGWRLG